MQQLGYYSPNLTSLAMLHYPITQPSFRAMGQYCQQLTELQLIFKPDLRPETYSAIVDCPLQKLPHLTSFTLNDESASDAIVLPVVKTFLSLKHLELRYGKLSDVTLDTIASFQPGVTKVDVSVNDGLTLHGVRRLTLGCPLLTWCGTCLLLRSNPEWDPYSTQLWVDRANYLDQEALDDIRFASHRPEEDEND
ncbi:hypothetical protein BCR42DRAFT_386862 [Absidia repens]|uniref:F-box domain-containing protein n=1 Tax=Absidia repens TaxID=90262 RepID=A0A1X2IZ60_9FUNG|nr:hypothetical protein BCR42DRAFT_386862 [Absidia repens]